LNNPIIIFCGKSASGKDALLKELVKNYGFKPIVSATSRPIRDGEIDHVDYHFKSTDEFQDMIRNDELVEYRAYDTLINGSPKTCYYGVPKSSIEQNNDKYVAVLELKGLAKFKELFKDRVITFLIEADNKIRKDRAEKRGSFNEKEWNRRLETDDYDFNMSAEFYQDFINHTITNNGDLTIEELANLIVDMIKE